MPLRHLLGPRSPNGKALDRALYPLPRSQRSLLAFRIQLHLVELRSNSDLHSWTLDDVSRGSAPAVHGMAQLLEIPAAIPLLNHLSALQQNADALGALALPAVDLDTPVDWLGPLYLDWIDSATRRQLGEHYTPGWLVNLLLDGIGWPERSSDILLDPACGSGAFLLSALYAYRRSFPGRSSDQYLASICGFEVLPWVAASARVNLILALRDLAPPNFLPVFQRNALELHDAVHFLDRKVTHLCANPPWIRWERRDKSDMEQKSLWAKLGLFTNDAWRNRMGQGKKDVAALFVAMAGATWLQERGKCAFVLPRSILVGRPARGLRMACEAGLLTPTAIHNFARHRLFSGTTNSTSVIFLEKASGAPVRTIVPYLEWSTEQIREIEISARAGAGPQPQPFHFPPNKPGDPWAPAANVSLSPVTETSANSNRIHYMAREGANTGGANGVFWVEVLEQLSEAIYVRNRPDLGRQPIPVVHAWLEKSFVCPLVRGRDVGRWTFSSSYHLVLTQDAQTRCGISLERMATSGSKTLNYLCHFKAFLSTRPLFVKYFRVDRDPWYSIYNVGPYTLAPWKVVWRELSSRLEAAVIGSHGLEQPIIPDHKLMIISCESEREAHFICAVLNAPIHTLVANRFSLVHSRGPHLLEHLCLPTFDPHNHLHSNLSELSFMAHAAVKCGDFDGTGVDQRLDDLVKELGSD